MRPRIWFTNASMICWVALASHGPLAAAEEDAARSTIRLCSATEPVRDSAASQPVPQEPAQVADRDEPPVPTPPNVDPSPRAGEPAATRTPGEPPVANRPRMPAGFYPSAAARTTLSQLPGPAPVQSAPRLQQNRRNGKPFQALPTEPAISPYLYLNAGKTNTSTITNYYAFVRPQLDQMEADRQHQRDIQQLRKQVQKISSGGAAPQPAADAPTAAHYMDTAQFYRGLQR